MLKFIVSIIVLSLELKYFIFWLFLLIILGCFNFDNILFLFNFLVIKRDWIIYSFIWILIFIVFWFLFSITFILCFIFILIFIIIFILILIWFLPFVFLSFIFIIILLLRRFSLSLVNNHLTFISLLNVFLKTWKIIFYYIFCHFLFSVVLHIFLIITF